LGTGKGYRSAKRRSVYVNGVYCESLTAGAREASQASGRDISFWQIQRVVNGKLKIPGLDISEKPPRLIRKEVDAVPASAGKRRGTLIRYPLGGSPLDIGIGHFWR
jgi:hypothetical protein